MSESNKEKRTRICPMKVKGDYCCGDQCEWHIRNEKYLKGDGLCAIVLSGFSAFLLQDIDKKVE